MEKNSAINNVCAELVAQTFFEKKNLYSADLTLILTFKANSAASTN